MFNKILIANRGEIACRVIKTAKKMGVRTVAVYSDADRKSLHVSLADEAVFIGPSPAAESYLCQDKILHAAKLTGAQAIHPGYGFLSENSTFCKKCEQNDIVFIGPPASAIAAMGSKSAAKKIMEEAGVPLVPGYHGNEQAPEFLKNIADEMGYPVLLKAAAGGGGRGMRPVYKSEEFFSALKDAKRESLSSFGDDHMLVEKYLAKPRHVEVQVFCDTLGNAVYLFDRDCSIQRRHQKVIEEAPAPGLSDDLRRAMGEAAVKAAQAIDYVGAGTVEFLLDTHSDNPKAENAGSSKKSAFYFMEMNTRLQVEHPVSELITKTDLVEWQLRVANGQRLPLLQAEIAIHGHAMEARIYAEDTQQNYCPSTGDILYFSNPKSSLNVRIDSGVMEGDSISAFYDSMISKLITWDEDRESCRQRMVSALDECQVVGVSTNIALLKNIFAHKGFADAAINTHFLDEHKDTLHKVSAPEENTRVALACLYMLKRQTRDLLSQRSASTENCPWRTLGAWRMNQDIQHRIVFNDQDSLQEYLVEELGSTEVTKYRIKMGEDTLEFSGRLAGRNLSAEIAGVRVNAECIDTSTHDFALVFNGHVCTISPARGVFESGSDSAGAGVDTAPMSGRVLEIFVKPEAQVEKGDPILVMEAMKMEHTIVANKAGRILDILCQAGELVEGGKQLFTLEIGESAEA